MTQQPSEPLDIHRLQQALTVEAERGFGNLRGKACLFAEFVCSSLSNPPLDRWEARDRDRARTLAQQFERYAEASLSQRQHLVAETRRFLYEIRRRELTESGSPFALTPAPSKSATPKVAALQSSPTHKVAKPAPSASMRLDSSLETVPGVGTGTARMLLRLGLQTVRDVLHYFPRDHIDYAQQVAIADLKELEEGRTVTVVAELRRFNCFTSPKNPNLTIADILLRDRTGTLKISRFWAGKWFTNRGWQEQQKKLYPVGAIVAVSGAVKHSRYGTTLTVSAMEVLESERDSIDSRDVGRLVPVYPLVEGVVPEQLRRVVALCLPLARQIPDPMPEAIRQKYGLVSLGNAIAHIHYPDSHAQLDTAIARLAFEKYFYRRLVSLHRRQQQQTAAFAPTSTRLVEQLEGILPFQLTRAQRRVVEELRGDLGKPTPMNRLVQGDVGAGKTIVAVYALLMAIEAGFQTALMAPTEVLAEQHYRKIAEWFAQLHLPVELLTGSTRAAKRRQILSQLGTGELPLAIGTHALIQEGVTFARLGLAVIDEQHRFGRDQRSRLLQKGSNPHVLIMTATPIPRTLYLTNSEIEVSIIDELPPGRKPIHTTLLRPNQRRHAYDLMRREIAQGRQVYVVLPLVEESEKLADVRAAVEERELLQSQIFPNFRVGLLHGQMSSAEKDEAIAQFRRGETHILVATTVVEVGVDVPNATVMAIEHADRFGLAQLHQLRGRVGRGAAQSYCLLLSSSRSETAIERLQVLVESQDGFYIAERDFALRGKGNDEGREQSGHSAFSIEDRLPDEAARQEILQQARTAAEALFDRDPTLATEPKLQAELHYHYDRLQGGAIFT